MSAPVVNLSDRREAERRAAFGVQPGDTAVPIGYLASRLLDQIRVRLAAARNAEAQQ